MATTIKYKGQTLAEVTDGTKILHTSGKVTEGNISIACDGTTATVKKSSATLVSIADGETKTLNCAARFLDGDITVESAGVAPAGVTLAAGTYVCKDKPSFGYSDEYKINFTCDGVIYNTIRASGDGYMVYAYIENGVEQRHVPVYDFDYLQVWNDSKYKTVILSTDQTVTTEAGEWFNANFTKQPDAVTITSGAYVTQSTANKILTGNWGTQNIAFTSNNRNYIGMTIKYGGSLSYNYEDEDGIPYINKVAEFDDGEGLFVWLDSNAKSIIISTDQTVSSDFGVWFEANFNHATGGGN